MIKAVSFVDKDEFESFIIGIAKVNETPLLIFGPEFISCNTMDNDGQILFSGKISHYRSSIQPKTTFDVQVNLSEVIEDLSQFGSGEIALMVDDVAFKIEIDPSTTCYYNLEKPCCIDIPRYDWPLSMEVECKYLEYIVTNLSSSPSLIFSREQDNLLIGSHDWEKFVTVCKKDINYHKDRKGSFGTMIATDLFKKVVDDICLFESVLIGLGEDIPLVLLGTSDRLKMGFMIGAQVEDDDS